MTYQNPDESNVFRNRYGIPTAKLYAVVGVMTNNSSKLVDTYNMNLH